MVGSPAGTGGNGETEEEKLRWLFSLRLQVGRRQGGNSTDCRYEEETQEEEEEEEGRAAR